MNPKIFRAYDIRGKYPSEINEEVVYKITQSLGRYFNLKTKNSKLKAKVVIGRDARLSSPSLYKAVLESLKTSARGGSAFGGKSYKLKTIPVGLATTPMFYFLVNHLKADGGIMITASHNPKNFNGLKMVGKNAVPISGKDIFKIMNDDDENK